MTVLGKVNLSIDHLISESGYIPNYHSNKNNVFFKTMLKSLISDGLLNTSYDLDKVKNNQLFTLEIPSVEKLFKREDYCSCLSICEFDKIIYGKTNTSKSVVISVYVYLKKFILKKNTEYKRVGMPSKYGVQKKLGISSKTTIDSAIEDLKSLNMIYEQVGGFYIDKDGLFTPTNNVYSLEKKELVHAEQILCEYYNTEKIYKKNEIDIDKLKYQTRNHY